MARDGHLPHTLSAVHPKFHVPHHGEIAVGLAVALLVSAVDLRGAIGFSSFAVLAYYAVANASAWTLTSQESRPPRIVPVIGLPGCVVLAGLAVLLPGAAIWGVRQVFRATDVRLPQRCGGGVLKR